MVGHMFQLFLELFKVITVLKNANLNYFSMWRSPPKISGLSLDSNRGVLAKIQLRLIFILDLAQLFMPKNTIFAHF